MIEGELGHEVLLTFKWLKTRGRDNKVETSRCVSVKWVLVGRQDRLQLRLGIAELCRVLEARVRNMYTVLQASKNCSPR